MCSPAGLPSEDSASGPCTPLGLSTRLSSLGTEQPPEKAGLPVWAFCSCRGLPVWLARCLCLASPRTLCPPESPPSTCGRCHLAPSRPSFLGGACGSASLERSLLGCTPLASPPSLCPGPDLCLLIQIISDTRRQG
ncbi:hypothetical protein HJG60_011067 [Phyllostomus discolor]|uniref:Uncharacterized protein n=1 Tax=Phyllostomus discolor TaxID=89673 RepID=A0A834AHL9_9CHIR|nr:hypothetical protein HJG60_011067 [Phyllostomus discolor]